MTPGMSPYFFFFFNPQWLIFRSPLPTGRMMAASIKSLSLNLEETKHISNCLGPPYFPYLSSFPCIFSVFLSPAVDLGLPSAEVVTGQVPVLPTTSPQAASPETLPDEHQVFKGKPLLKEAESHATEIPSPLLWPLSPSKSGLLDLCCDG